MSVIPSEHVVRPTTVPSTRGAIGRVGRRSPLGSGLSGSGPTPGPHPGRDAAVSPAGSPFPDQHRHLLPSPVRARIPPWLMVTVAPGLGEHVRHGALGADPVALRDVDGRTRGSVRARRRRLADRHTGCRPPGDALPDCTTVVRPMDRRDPAPGGTGRPVAEPLGAPPGRQLTSSCRDDSSLAPISQGRARAVVAAAADLAVGHGSRDVAGGDRYRLRHGGNTDARTAVSGTAPRRPGHGAAWLGARRGRDRSARSCTSSSRGCRLAPRSSPSGTTPPTATTPWWLRWSSPPSRLCACSATGARWGGSGLRSCSAGSDVRCGRGAPSGRRCVLVPVVAGPLQLTLGDRPSGGRAGRHSSS